MTAIRILEFRSVQKGALRGFAKIALSSGMIISDVTILAGDRGPWASPPSKPMVGAAALSCGTIAPRSATARSSSLFRGKSGRNSAMP